MFYFSSWELFSIIVQPLIYANKKFTFIEIVVFLYIMYHLFFGCFQDFLIIFSFKDFEYDLLSLYIPFLRFINILDSVYLCLSLNMGTFWSLFLQIFFIPCLFFFSPSKTPCIHILYLFLLLYHSHKLVFCQQLILFFI